MGIGILITPYTLINYRNQYRAKITQKQQTSKQISHSKKARRSGKTELIDLSLYTTGIPTPAKSEKTVSEEKEKKRSRVFYAIASTTCSGKKAVGSYMKRYRIESFIKAIKDQNFINLKGFRVFKKEKLEFLLYSAFMISLSVCVFKLKYGLKQICQWIKGKSLCETYFQQMFAHAKLGIQSLIKEIRLLL